MLIVLIVVLLILTVFLTVFIHLSHSNLKTEGP